MILLADVHAFLDSECIILKVYIDSCKWLTKYPFPDLKAPIELVNNRAEYYRKVITALLQAVGVSTDKLEFVLGSSYQKSPEYIMDVYKLSSLVSEHDGM